MSKRDDLKDFDKVCDAVAATSLPKASPAAPRKRNYAVAIAFAAGMLIMAMLAAGAYFVLSKGTRGTSVSGASQSTAPTTVSVGYFFLTSTWLMPEFSSSGCIMRMP